MTKGVDDKNSGASPSAEHLPPLLLTPDPLSCTGACRSHKAAAFMRASRASRRRVTGYEACDDLNEHAASLQSSCNDENNRVSCLTKGRSPRRGRTIWTHGEPDELSGTYTTHCVQRTSVLRRCLTAISKYVARVTFRLL